MKVTKLISRWRRHMYDTSKKLGDVQAVLKGRLVNRVQQRVYGKFSRRGLNKIIKG